MTRQAMIFMAARGCRLGPVVQPLDHSIGAGYHGRRAFRRTPTERQPRRKRVPLQAVEPKRLYRQIADQLAHLIARGEFPAGSRLPAERELAVSLGVSRTSVREAIISLEMNGLVEVRVGTGIFVTNPPPEPDRLPTDAGPGP